MPPDGLVIVDVHSFFKSVCYVQYTFCQMDQVSISHMWHEHVAVMTTKSIVSVAMASVLFLLHAGSVNDRSLGGAFFHSRDHGDRR